MDKRSYEILSGDTLVAIWKDNRLETVNETLLPLYLKNIKIIKIIKNADTWIETRAIDSHRANNLREAFSCVF